MLAPAVIFQRELMIGALVRPPANEVHAGGYWLGRLKTRSTGLAAANQSSIHSKHPYPSRKIRVILLASRKYIAQKQTIERDAPDRAD